MLHNLFATKNQHNFNSLRTFQVIWKTSAKLGLLDKDVGGYLGGAKSIASKTGFWGSARAKFLRQPLVTYKTFASDRFSIFFFLTSKKRIVENGVCPPPLSF